MSLLRLANPGPGGAGACERTRARSSDAEMAQPEGFVVPWGGGQGVTKIGKHGARTISLKPCSSVPQNVAIWQF